MRQKQRGLTGTALVRNRMPGGVRGGGNPRLLSDYRCRLVGIYVSFGNHQISDHPAFDDKYPLSKVFSILSPAEAPNAVAKIQRPTAISKLV